MIVFTVWLLVSTSPITGDVFVSSHSESGAECLYAASVDQECTEPTVLRRRNAK